MELVIQTTGTATEVKQSIADQIKRARKDNPKQSAALAALGDSMASEIGPEDGAVYTVDAKISVSISGPQTLNDALREHVEASRAANASSAHPLPASQQAFATVPVAIEGVDATRPDIAVAEAALGATKRRTPDQPAPVTEVATLADKKAADQASPTK